MSFNCKGVRINANNGYVFIGTFKHNGIPTDPCIWINEDDFEIRE